MDEDIKIILEQLYEQTSDIEALKEALISLVHKGVLSIDDVKILDNHYAAETLFDTNFFMSFVRLIAEKEDYYAPKNLYVLLRKMYQRDSNHPFQTISTSSPLSSTILKPVFSYMRRAKLAFWTERETWA